MLEAAILGLSHGRHSGACFSPLHIVTGTSGHSNHRARVVVLEAAFNQR